MKEFQNVKPKISTNNTVKLLPKNTNKKNESISLVNFDSSFFNENVEEIFYSTNTDKLPYDNDIKIMNKTTNNITNLYKTDNIKRLKQKLKGPTPKADEINTLLPKKQKNHLLENKNLKKIPVRAKGIKYNKEQLDNINNKNNGRITDFINKYKQEADNKKEEKQENLDGFNKTKVEIENTLFSLPIGLRILSMQNKKTELECKLDELDIAINQFSKKKVFIKSCC